MEEITMHVVTVYLDEDLKTRDLVQLKREIMEMPYVHDVELARKDHHDITIEYEEHTGMPGRVLTMMRHKGLHPDVISA
jgi:hypothetical protein